MTINSPTSAPLPELPVRRPSLGSIASNTSPHLPLSGASAVDRDESGKPGNTVPDGVVQERQAERYRLQSTARKLLPEVGRLQNCGVARVDASKPVQVFGHPVTGALYLGNVQTCGKWYCPTCGPRLQAMRRRETVRLAEVAAGDGWGLLQANYTFGHGAADDITGLLALQREAFKRGSAGKRALSQRLKRAGIDYAGQRRALDYTYGLSGHHPHEHAVLVVDADWADEVAELVAEHGADMLRRAGLDCGAAGVTVQMIDAAGAGYLFKSGQRPDAPGQTSRTHFQLLRDAAAGDDHAGAVYRELARATDGMRLVSTSPGLKKRFRLLPDELQADHLARLPAEPGVLVAELPDWRGMDADTWESLTAPALGLAAD